MLRDEEGLLTGYVYVDVSGRDLMEYVEGADRVIREKLKPPPGYSISCSGQYEAMERGKRRLLIIIPLTVFPDAALGAAYM